MLTSQFINFSLNFELSRLVDCGMKKSLIEKRTSFSFRDVSLVPPRLIPTVGPRITFLILTDGSLLTLDYTLPLKSESKKSKFEVYNCAISRSDYFSAF
jgi:hypothetical protein